MSILPLAAARAALDARAMTTTSTPLAPLAANAALIVIDVQQAFRDPIFGIRNNSGSEANIAALTAAWTLSGRPIVRVRHASLGNLDPERSGPNPLHPDAPGYAFEPFVAALTPELDIVKHVHSAFHGDVDLDGWLRAREIRQLGVCGIQTNLCCETTSRVGGNLGYEVFFAHDATHTFDQQDPVTGRPVTADELAAATRSNLSRGFATVTTTSALLARTSLAERG